MASDNARDADRARDLMNKIGFAMLVTRDGSELRARPMAAYVERDHNAVYFLSGARPHKDDEIARDPNVNLAFANTSDQKYVSVTAPQRSRTIVPRSGNCFRRRRKHGGKVLTIPTFACSKLSLMTRNSGIRLAPLSAP